MSHKETIDAGVTLIPKKPTPALTPAAKSKQPEHKSDATTGTKKKTKEIITLGSTPSLKRTYRFTNTEDQLVKNAAQEWKKRNPHIRMSHEQIVRFCVRSTLQRNSIENLKKILLGNE